MANPDNINGIPPSGTMLIDQKGLPSPPWYRYFVSLRRGAVKASSGEVSTLPGSGLEGGGAVQDGVDLSIAPDGVTNAMLRESLPLSVIGRFINSTGNPADIQARANFRVLTREDDQLAFRSYMDGVTIGQTTAAPLVRCDAFELDQAPAAGVIVPTHTITISVNGVNYKIPLVAA